MTNEERKIYNSKYWRKNSEKLKVGRKEHAEEIKQYDKQYRKNHLTERKQYNAQYKKDNAAKEKLYQTQYQNQYRKSRRQTDLSFKMTCILRRRLASVIKGKFKAGSAIRDLGCSMEDFRKHIEQQFKSEMTWENYGKGGWQFDHIIPLTKFDLTDRKQFCMANHYTNIQPLWWKDNQKKRKFFRRGF